MFAETSRTILVWLQTKERYCGFASAEAKTGIEPYTSY